MIFALTMILLGVIFTAMVFVRKYYNALFSGETIEYQAKLVEIRDSINTDGGLVCPIVKYESDNGTVKAHSFMPIQRSSLNYRVGDTISIIVPAKKPKLFMISGLELNSPEDENRMQIILAGIGIGCLVIGAFALMLM